ncbi:hypothetical protein [Hydrogenophaga taeniospiralis]|nr:hypothetical protein [Hydrogenophaga taeniospiralis]UCU94571.1 hypothetical protein KI616_01405 [Hydrogenophaga taeniospiralis]
MSAWKHFSGACEAYVGQVSATSSHPFDRKFATSSTGSGVQPPQADPHQ